MLKRGKMPTKEEVLEVAHKMYLEDCIRNGVPPLTPEEHELKEAGYYERAKLYLMRNIHAEELEEEFRREEINYAQTILERNNYIVRPPTMLEDPLLLEMEIRTLKKLKHKATMQKYAKLVR